ncbi:MAG: diguanylate cyclase, partial [Emcibacteraceae bacterium]|nr:diguanylate cyclase [Emcibacteraceae bacterium]
GTLQKASQILECNEELRRLAQNEEKPLSLSIGIALSHPNTEISLDTLMEQADMALYDVKNNGKSGIALNQ